MFQVFRLWLLSLLGHRMVIPAADGPSNSNSSSPSPAPSTEADNGTKNPDQGKAATSGAPWLALARKEDGTREIPGPRHNPRVLAYYADAGHPEISDDETAWCAAFVGAMLKRSGYIGTRSLMARSYAKYGTDESKTRRIGSIVVMTRGRDDGVYGHVGFLVGEDAKSVYVLGGNQSKAVNVKKFPKSMVIAYRWPPMLTNSRTVKGGVLSLTGETMRQTSEAIPQTSDIPDQLQQAGSQLQALADFKWWLGAIGTALLLIGIAWMLYARWDDMKNKGR